MTTSVHTEPRGAKLGAPMYSMLIPSEVEWQNLVLIISSSSLCTVTPYNAAACIPFDATMSDHGHQWCPYELWSAHPSHLESPSWECYGAVRGMMLSTECRSSHKYSPTSKIVKMPVHVSTSIRWFSSSSTCVLSRSHSTPILTPLVSPLAVHLMETRWKAFAVAFSHVTAQTTKHSNITAGQP